MKMVYTAENQFLVTNVQNQIEAQGIRTFVKNEFAQGAVGEVAVFDTWPEVWVYEDKDEAKALEIVTLARQQEHGPEWICKSCSELNDSSFELCWNCQSDRN